MKKTTTLFLLLIFSAVASAEKLEDRYIMQPVQAGLLYFIKPFDVRGTSGLQAAEYDITYILPSDSLTLNMSVWLPEPVNADSIVFCSAENMTVTGFRTFFIDKEKSRYHHRYSCTIPYNYLLSIYQHGQPYTMTIHAGTREFRYGFPESSWKKECQWMNQVLRLIDTNRQVRNTGI